MIPIGLGELEEFEKEFDRYQENQDKLLSFLISKYKDRGIGFHHIFLRSKVALKMGISLLEKFAKAVEYLELEDVNRVVTDLAFISHVMIWHERYVERCTRIISSPESRICAEDFLLYLEYVSCQVARGVPIFGHNYKRVSESQLGHFHESFDLLIELINKNSIKFSRTQPAHVNDQCRELFEAVASMNSMRNYFDEISIGASIPIFGLEKEYYFYLSYNPAYWSKMEKYRDLNYLYQDQLDNSDDEVSEIMNRTGALKIYGENDIWKIDAARLCNFDSALKFHQKYKLLIPIYGRTDTSFLYKDKYYTIQNLLTMYEKLYTFVIREWEKDTDNPAKMIRLVGRKSLIKILGMKGEAEQDLLDLISYDFDIDKHNMVQYKPLLKKGDLFFILPARVMQMSEERIVDKILSNQVSVIFKEGKGNNWKGIAFEHSIEEFLINHGFHFSKVDRNNKRKIPEIDGAFLLDNYVFIYEAKAFIKPECTMEAYDRLRDILLKAKEQLDLRMDMILNNPGAREYIESELGFTFEGKIITPFILVNNRFFAGYREFKNNWQNLHYPVVDFDDLKGVLINWKVPVWNYNDKKDNYRRTRKSISTAEELWYFMLSQFDYLETYEKPLIAYGIEGIAYQVARPMEIHRWVKERFLRYGEQDG